MTVFPIHPDRVARYMRWAREAAADSKDTTRVGAVLISPQGIRLLSCYNGPPMGVRDLPERRVAPVKYFYAAHAEANLIAFAASVGLATQGLTMAVTHRPCIRHNCVPLIIQAGIKRLIFGGGSAVMPLDEDGHGSAMLAEAGVEVIAYDD